VYNNCSFCFVIRPNIFDCTHLPVHTAIVHGWHITHDYYIINIFVNHHPLSQIIIIITTHWDELTVTTMCDKCAVMFPSWVLLNLTAVVLIQFTVRQCPLLSEHQTSRRQGGRHAERMCCAVFQAPNYKAECVLTSRPPDEEEERPNLSPSLLLGFTGTWQDPPDFSLLTPSGHRPRRGGRGAYLFFTVVQIIASLFPNKSFRVFFPMASHLGHMHDTQPEWGGNWNKSSNKLEQQRRSCTRQLQLELERNLMASAA
jgi:hypothetical protein